MLSNIFNFIANMFRQALVAVTSIITRLINDEIIPLVKQFGSVVIQFLAIELGLMSYDPLA